MTPPGIPCGRCGRRHAHHPLCLRYRPKICRHCKGPSQHLRPRGLCWACYEDVEIRVLYAYQQTKFMSRGHGLREPRGHGEPTAYLPGDPRKTEVLVERARQGLELWHPRDAQVSTS